MIAHGSILWKATVMFYWCFSRANFSDVAEPHSRTLRGT